MPPQARERLARQIRKLGTEDARRTHADAIRAIDELETEERRDALRKMFGKAGAA